ncbi:hypothetical protein JX266_003867 [Neoarthrinium moseri]|nr:hypothetical protein JX266_003867 [Neoarthrinium moseri]
MPAEDQAILLSSWQDSGLRVTLCPTRLGQVPTILESGTVRFSQMIVSSAHERRIRLAQLFPAPADDPSALRPRVNSFRVYIYPERAIIPPTSDLQVRHHATAASRLPVTRKQQSQRQTQHGLGTKESLNSSNLTNMSPSHTISTHLCKQIYTSWQQSRQPQGVAVEPSAPSAYLRRSPSPEKRSMDSDRSDASLAPSSPPMSRSTSNSSWKWSSR